MRVTLVLILLTAVIVSGCASPSSEDPVTNVSENNSNDSSQFEVSAMVQNLKLVYDEDAKIIVEHDVGVEDIPGYDNREDNLDYGPGELKRFSNITHNLEVNFSAESSETTGSYYLSPGLYLKIFEKSGDLLNSKRIDEEKNYSISFDVRSKDISGENTEIFSCFVTKKFNENYNWDFEDRGNESVHCESFDIPEINPGIDIEGPVVLDANDLNEENPILVERIEVQNSGKYGMDFAIGFENGEKRIDTKNGYLDVDVHNQSRCCSLSATGSEPPYGLYLEPDESKSVYLAYYANEPDKFSLEDIKNIEVGLSYSILPLSEYNALSGFNRKDLVIESVE